LARLQQSPHYSGDAGPASRARLYAAAVTVDSSGNVLLSSPFRVRAVAASNGHFYGRKMRARDIYTVVGTGTASSGDGGPARRAEFAAGNIAEGGSGNLVIADNQAEVRLVAAASGRFFGQKMTKGEIYAIAGDGRFGSTGDRGPATKASIDVSAMATDSTGNVLIAGFSHRRVRVVAARSGVLYGQRLIAGHIYTMAGSGGTGVSGNGRRAVTSPVDDLQAVATDHAGNVLLADIRNPADQSTDQVQVVAAKSGTFYGRQMTAGDIYTIAGNGQTAASGDGGPATAAGMSPSSLAVDNSGDVLIGDSSNGDVRVIAAKTGTFYGQQMTAGDIYTIAQGSPGSMVVDNAGNVLIADSHDVRVRAVAVVSGTFYGVAMTAGDIYTIAGNGKAGFTGDGGPAISAELFDLSELALGPKGNLLIAGGSHVRSVTP
jgi:trimeric autotransporter adhesin